MIGSDKLTQTSGAVVQFVLVANRVLLGAFLAGFLATWIWPASLAVALLGSGVIPNAAQAIIGIRLEVLIGILMSVCADRIFVALRHILASTRQGDPFILANAHHLRTIGWSLLVLQLLSIPGEMLGRFFPMLGDAAPRDSFGDIFSVGGWISVLMVFILSRIFAAGAAMRADLEGTV